MSEETQGLEIVYLKKDILRCESRIEDLEEDVSTNKTELLALKEKVKLPIAIILGMSGLMLIAIIGAIVKYVMK